MRTAPPSISRSSSACSAKSMDAKTSGKRDKDENKSIDNNKSHENSKGKNAWTTIQLSSAGTFNATSSKLKIDEKKEAKF